jgi:hypothetical protein
MIDEPKLTLEVFKQFLDTHKEVYNFAKVCFLIHCDLSCKLFLLDLYTFLVEQMLANRSKLKFAKLKAVEDGLHQLNTEDAQIGKKTIQIVGLQHQLDAIKLERTWEVWLLKKQIENLIEKQIPVQDISR